jgi:NifU-like protein involved in Fe-S cluster formation
MTGPLYTRDLLALAVAVGDYPRLAQPDASGDKRAPLCGSRVALDLMVDGAGHIANVGLAVEACALGQGAACLFARGSVGRDAGAIQRAHRDLADWLTQADASAPQWPGIEILAPARAHPARHAAILLPFELAAALMSGVAASGKAA